MSNPYYPRPAFHDGGLSGHVDNSADLPKRIGVSGEVDFTHGLHVSFYEDGPDEDCTTTVFEATLSRGAAQLLVELGARYLAGPPARKKPDNGRNATRRHNAVTRLAGERGAC